MVNHRDNVQELSSLWTGVMQKCREIAECIPAEQIKSLSDTEISIIHKIAAQNDIVIGDISKDLFLPKSTVTGLVARLERKKFIRRTINRDDLRTFGLVLTQKGVRVQQEHRKFEHAFFNKLIEPLSKAESNELMELLRVISTQGGCKNEN